MRAGIGAAPGNGRDGSIEALPGKLTMGRKSGMEKPPEDLRAGLTEMSRDQAHTQAGIADAINAAAGGPLVSKSSLNRYAQRMKKFAEKTGRPKR